MMIFGTLDHCLPGCNMPGIYMLENVINKKRYIGQSINISKRLKEHRIDAFLKNRTNYDYPLYRAIRKYSPQMFSVWVITFVTNLEGKELFNELNKLEKMYIKSFQTNNPDKGYNLAIGGEGTRKYCFTLEEKLDIASKYLQCKSLYCLSKKTNISEPVLSEVVKSIGVTTKVDILERDILISRLYSLGLSMKQIETRLNLSHGLVQKSLKRSGTEMRSQAQIVTRHCSDALKKTVVEFKDGIAVGIYPSLASAAKTKGLKSSSSISDACNKNLEKNKTAGGSKWMYVKKNEIIVKNNVKDAI